MEGIQLKLPIFEGPLDLLLHLINRAQIDIKDVFVSQITEQYLAYIHQMEVYNMDISSEFVEMAATLLLIKSRSILPSSSQDTDEEDLETMLLEQLEEYQRFRDIAKELQSLEIGARGMYYKLREEFAFEPDPLDMSGIDLHILHEIMTSLLQKNLRRISDEPQGVTITKQKNASVRSKMQYIQEMLTLRSLCFFSEMLLAQCTKDEVIATFLALLELMNAGYVTIAQNVQFGDIIIQKNDAGGTGQ